MLKNTLDNRKKAWNIKKTRNIKNPTRQSVYHSYLQKCIKSQYCYLATRFLFAYKQTWNETNKRIAASVADISSKQTNQIHWNKSKLIDGYIQRCYTQLLGYTMSKLWYYTQNMYVTHVSIFFICIICAAPKLPAYKLYTINIWNSIY